MIGGGSDEPRINNEPKKKEKVKEAKKGTNPGSGHRKITHARIMYSTFVSILRRGEISTLDRELYVTAYPILSLSATE